MSSDFVEPRVEAGWRSQVGRTALFIAVAGVVTGTGHSGPGAFANLPVQLDLKDRLHLGPAAVATTLAIVGAPWYAKPLASVVTDVLPIRGSRRRAYLLLAIAGATAAWVAFALEPAALGPMVLVLLGVELSVMLASAVLGAVLVEAGRARRATGRLTSVRMSAIFVGGLAAGPVGGWLATRPLAYTACVAIALQAALLSVALGCIEEPRSGAAPGEALRRLFSVFRSRALLVTALVGFLVLTAPGFGTPLLFRQTEELGHSAQFVGFTRMSGTLAAAVAAVAYGFFCRWFRLRTILVVAVVLHAASALLFLGFGPPGWAALAIVAAYGGCSGLVLLALWDLSARAAPPGYEGLAYALMMSALNGAQSLSDVVGSLLHDRFAVGFGTLVWINCLSTLAVLLALPLVPRALLDVADGHHHER